MLFIFYSETNIGRKREKNEDYMQAYSPASGCHIYMVLDGIGGANSGEVASRVAAEKTVEYLKDHYEKDKQNIENVKMAIKYANRCVYEMNKQNKVYKDMGTTIALIYVEDSDVYYISIGDTRIYSIEENEIKQLTEDDTYVNALVRDNIISSEEAKTHPERHVLLRALGVTKAINFDINKIEDAYGKKFLMCTDGLTGSSSDEEIFNIIKSKDAKAICPELIKLANEKGGMDNITVMYIEV